MTISKLDKKFDENIDDILEYFDISKIKMINEESKRVVIDIPRWMLNSLDREAQHIGVTREALIKIWLAERLKSIDK